jgi:peroxiredoxin
VVLGASFDMTTENKTFADAQQFPFRLLSDVDRQVGTAYEVVRGADEQYPNFAMRIAYLIDSTGTIRRSYEVTDVAGFAEAVLGDLQLLEQE